LSKGNRDFGGSFWGPLFRTFEGLLGSYLGNTLFKSSKDFGMTRKGEKYCKFDQKDISKTIKQSSSYVKK
jgi:hypothetical protein